MSKFEEGEKIMEDFEQVVFKNDQILDEKKLVNKLEKEAKL